MPGSINIHANSKSVVETNKVNKAESEKAVRQSTRNKTLSLTAKEAKLTELNRLLQSLCVTADKNHARVVQALDNDCPVSQLEKLEQELMNHLTQVEQVYDTMRKLSDTLDPNIRTQTDRLYSDRDVLVNKIKDMIRNKTKPVAIEKPRARSHAGDSVSDQQSSSSKARSDWSKKLSEKRASATAARKKLEAEMELDELEREIQEKQRQLKLKRMSKMVEIEEEEAAALEEELAQEDEERSIKSQLFCTNLSKHSIGILKPMALPQDPDIMLDPPQRANPPAPTEATQTVMQPQVDAISKSLADALMFSRLPAPEPTVFIGDPLGYADWNRTFSALIDNRAISVIDKIYYLKRYTGGEAKEAINGYLLLGTTTAYNNAREKLREKYGNKFVMIDAFRDKLDKWPKLHGKAREQLQRLADFLQQCATAMEEIPELTFLNDERECRKILQKLPDWLVNKWSVIASDSKAEKGKYPTFQRFADFMTREARIANEPSTIFPQTSAPDKPSATRKPSVPPRIANSLNTTAHEAPSCLFCETSTHKTTECRGLSKQSDEKKKQFVWENHLCFGCLRKGHSSKQCKRRNTCSKCEKSHPTALHQDNIPKAKKVEAKHQSASNQSKQEEEPKVSHKISVEAIDNFSSAMIVPVWVSVRDQPAHEKKVYALLDSQSDITFMTTALCKQLNVSTEKTTIRLSTMTALSQQVTTEKVTNLRVRGLNSTEMVDLPAVYTRDNIPVNRNHIPSPNKAMKWPHLSHLAGELSEHTDCEIGLLIGYDCPQALTPREVVSGTANEPFAVKTDLGWSIVGKVSDPVDSVTHDVVLEDVGLQTVISAMNRDFVDDTCGVKIMSIEDQKFVKLMSDSIVKDETEHWSMPLPFHSRPGYNSSLETAKQRFKTLKTKFSRDEKYKAMYEAFINDIIDRKEAELVPEDELEEPSWYIPHFGVFHPKKPEKIRVVFDCSAKTNGECLNDYLIQGPDLMNSLLGILLRFREGKIAIMADVERMFHQFRVNQSDRNFLRFLWEEDGKMKTYRMAVHLFGAKSSPAAATFGLRTAAAQADEKETLARHYIENNFYVDDGLTSVDTEDEAIDLFETSVGLCKKSNINLHKFMSNNKEVMEKIPPKYRAKEVATLDLKTDHLPKERALGIIWCPEDDTFLFTSDQKEKPATRRGILSTVASIFDPIGFLAPFILSGKAILQEMCRVKAEWDDPLTDTLLPEWEKWVNDLKKLQQVSIPRYIHHDLTNEMCNQELHHFCDASTKGFGACTYLKVIDKDGKVSCTLLLAKAKVAPLKQTTIPRLELQAAVLASQLSKTVKQEMNFDHSTKEYFWTDSMIVLGYIKNETRKFSVYIANRIEVVRNRTNPESWYHVKSEDNPADHASRGLQIDNLMKSNWFRGPDFLYAESNYKTPVLQDDMLYPETRTCLTTIEQEPRVSLLDRVTKFSTWRSVTRGFSLIIDKISKTKKAGAGSRTRKDLLDEAEWQLIKWCQEEYFKKEIEELQRDNKLESPRLKDLDPFLDDKGLLRVGGRLRHALTLSYEEKHPVILPSNHHLSKLLIESCHQKTGHSGKNMTINRLRGEGYWIIGCGKAVSSAINKCTICKLLRANTCSQKMADLPQERLEPSPPFTFVGCDVFGPFEVREGRKTIKKNSCLFTCLTSRAVHLEVLDDMSTDAFISAFRCLTSLRGPVKRLYSDQGTNFKGAKSELLAALTEMSEDLQKALAEHKCEFMFNTPASSHMGGVWERQIRTVRSILNGLLLQNMNKLDTTGLRTLLYEVAAIINSRPIAIVSNINDPTEPMPLTPNHLLTQKGPNVPPPGDFDSPDLYSRKRWRKVQYLTNQFWARWQSEYIQGLQKRRKWQETTPNITVGTVVVLEDPNPLRSMWCLGVIERTIPSEDGLIRKVLVRKVNENGRCIAIERPITKLKILFEPVA